MFTELNSILNTNPDSVTQGEFILLSDRRSDASFLIHHFLSLYLKAGCRVWFVALVQSFNHYSAISQRLTTSLGGEQAAAPETDLQSDQTLTLRDRIAPPPLHIRKPSVAAVTQGVSLSQAKEKGQLVFLEGLKESLSVLIPQETDTGSDIMDFFRDPAAGLKSLYQFVSSSLTSDDDDEEGRGPPVLLVDDISILLSLGLSVGDVLDFSHYCRASVCSQGSVLMLARCEEEDDDGDDEGSERLLKGLTHLSSLSLHVQGLPTGYCRDIHGQVEVCWRRRQGDGQHSQKKVFQYKVHDKGASFFAPGTSSAVL